MEVHGATAVHAAARLGKADSIRLLCAAGAKVDEVDIIGRAETAETLPASVAEGERADSGDCTALHWSIRFGDHAAAVTALLET